VAGKILMAIETSEIWIDPDHVGRVGIVSPSSSTFGIGCSQDAVSFHLLSYLRTFVAFGTYQSGALLGSSIDLRNVEARDHLGDPVGATRSMEDNRHERIVVSGLETLFDSLQ
jgi:hypothetical protein